MKLGEFTFKPGARIAAGQMITGKVSIPPDAKIVHCGARMPEGSLCLWAEVSEIETPHVDMEFAILKAEDRIPKGYEFRGHILSTPLLFVYQKVEASLIIK